MIHRIEHPHLGPASIEWDNGLIVQNTTNTVLEQIERWGGEGIIYGTQPAPAPNPERNLADLAVLLDTNGWTLSPELVEALPPPHEIPEGAIA